MNHPSLKIKLPPSLPLVHYWPQLLTLVSWALFLVYVNTFPPISWFSYLPFFGLLGLAVFGLAFIFVSRFGLSLWITLFCLLLLLLQLFHLLGWLNLILVFALILTLSYIFR